MNLLEGVTIIRFSKVTQLYTPLINLYQILRAARSPCINVPVLNVLNTRGQVPFGGYNSIKQRDNYRASYRGGRLKNYCFSLLLIFTGKDIVILFKQWLGVLRANIVPNLFYHR